MRRSHLYKPDKLLPESAANLKPKGVQVAEGVGLPSFASPSTAIGFGFSPLAVLDKFTVKVYDKSARYREYEGAWELLEK